MHVPQASHWSDQFRKDGYIKFENLLPPDLGAEVTDQIRSGLLDKTEGLKILLSPPVWSLLESALGAGDFSYRPVAQVATIAARSSSEKTPPYPHIDGLPCKESGISGTRIRNFTALVGCYFSDVSEEFAGNFCVWPGSHKLLEQHFLQSGPQSLDEQLPAIAFGEPTQLMTAPGDVVLCHYLLAHGPAVNTSANDRLAVYFRISSKDLDLTNRDRAWFHLSHMWTGWKL